jgi:hypothetical protein
MTTTSSIWRSLLLTVALGCLGAVFAPAQTASVTPTTPAPAKGIGPAPANTEQHHILSAALSPQTRQTLQDAMNSFPEPAGK